MNTSARNDLQQHTTARLGDSLPFLRLGPRPDRTTYQGWQQWRTTRGSFVPAPKISLNQYRLMTPRKRAIHDLHRAASHVNMRLLETPMSARVTALMRARIQNNALRVEPGTRDGLMINGGGYQGKTETACQTAAEFEDFWWDLVEELGPTPIPGTRDLIAPVAYCQTPVKATPIALCEAILDFYAAPYGKNLRGMIRNVRGSIKAHSTSALLIDDITRLKMHREDDQDTLDLIRDLMSLDVTLILIGVNIPRSGLLREGWHDPRTGQWTYQRLKASRSYNPDASTQTERRFDIINLDPFDYTTDAGISAFLTHLAGVEDQLRLFDAGPGTLTEGRMPEYLYGRTGGIVGLLKRLLEDTCTRAMERGLETFTIDLCDEIDINLGNLPDRDPDAGEVPHIPDTTPARTPSKKRRNTVLDDRGTPQAADK
ncbi:hypothetical protein AB0M28_18485 [Streptomyces sp. NPDC051940]|uniref:hypothetical protein n=1 Tax=Streptomyces sp. NPDC051940 TaxID=3155675 RepID=UPI0034441326